jgi:hypothetical protein
MQTGLHYEEWEPVEEHATRTYQTWGFLDALACTEIHFVPGFSKMDLTHTHTHTNYASESSCAVWQLHRKSDLQHLLKNAWAWNAKIATDFTMRTMASDPAKKTVIRRACLGRYRPSLSQSSMLSIQEQLVNEMMANHERSGEWHKDIGNTYSCVIEGNDRQTGKEERRYNVRLRSVYPKSKHPQPCLTLARCSHWITSPLAANDDTDEMKHSQSQQRRQNSTKGLHHLLPESSNCKPLRRSWQVFWREQWGQSIS